MLPKVSLFCSRQWVVFILFLGCAVCFQTSHAKENILPFQYLEFQSEPAVRVQGFDAILAKVSTVLSQRSNSAVTLTLHDRISEEVRRSEEAKIAAPEKVEALKSAQIVWQSDIARQDMNRIMKFHAESTSDLASRLQWFWANHFSVFGMKRNVKLTLEDYDANALAPNITKRFDALLIAATLHPAMVLYLDNSANRKIKGNENLAREILELHTLGVDGGYTQDDVFNLARALTGVTVAGLKSGLTLNNCIPPNCAVLNSAGTILDRQQHDFGVKTLLGKKYQREDGLEILDMLTDLAAHPSTASNVSRKLLQYFVMDEPSKYAVETLAEVFKQSRGNLIAIYRKLFLDSSLHISRTERFSDPFTYAMRIVRLLRTAGASLGDYAYLNRVLRDWGQGLYMRITPDGYPLESDYWSGAASLTERLDSVEQMVQLAFVRSDRAVQDKRQLHWYVKKMKPMLLPSTQAMLARYEKDATTWLTYMLVSPELVF